MVDAINIKTLITNPNVLVNSITTIFRNECKLENWLMFRLAYFHVQCAPVLLPELDQDVILWRAVLRKTYHVLQTRIKPSTVPGLNQILAPIDVEEIRVKEERDGLCIQATDLLFGKLMALQTPGWPEIHVFLEALEQHHSKLVKALTDVYQRLKDNIFAVINFKVANESRVPSGIRNYWTCKVMCTTICQNPKIIST